MSHAQLKKLLDAVPGITIEIAGNVLVVECDERDDARVLAALRSIGLVSRVTERFIEAEGKTVAPSVAAFPKGTD